MKRFSRASHSLLTVQPQSTSEVIKVSVGPFTLQTTSQHYQILQTLKTSREGKTLKKHRATWKAAESSLKDHKDREDEGPSKRQEPANKVTPV